MANITGIVVAAGLGSRLSPYTDNCPKCMLDVQGRSILERCLSIFLEEGIDPIAVVGGYKADKLKLPSQVDLVLNTDYKNNNILHSLACARSYFKTADNVIVSYSDIVFKRSIVNQLVRDNYGDISILVDQSWQSRYSGRQLHPLEQAEAVKFDRRRRLVKTGKNLLTDNSDPECWGEFIGMMKLTRRGQSIFWAAFDRINTKIEMDDPFQGSLRWRNSYITDLMQEIVDQGGVINCSLIRGDWLEIDTSEDYIVASKFNFSEDGG